MAPPRLVRSNNSLPELPPGAGSKFEPRIVGGTQPGDTNVIVDAFKGTVRVEHDDGSLEIRDDESDARDKAANDDGFDRNLAIDMDEGELATIANALIQGIEQDLQSRRDWEEIRVKGMTMLGVKLEDAENVVSQSQTISKAQSTVMLEAVMRSWANSRAELLPTNGPVKVRDDQPASPLEEKETDAPDAESESPEETDKLPGVDDVLGAEPEGGIPGMGHNGGPPMGIVGPDEASAPPSIKDQAGQQPAINRSLLADSLEKDMNHYLTVVDKEYYPETSRMLFSRALTGVEFKKIYRCPLRRRPVSVWTKGENLIVSNDAVHLAGAGRVTERIPMRQSTVKRLMAYGHYKKIDLPTSPPMVTKTEQKVGEIQGINPNVTLSEDYPHIVYETYVELETGGLAKDENGKDVGYPLPYRVSIDKDSQKILEIRRNWKEGDEYHQARRRYVKFGFVPGLGFYDFGFAHILGNPQRTATAIMRILIDSGMFKSFPGGVIMKGLAARGKTVITAAPGEFAAIDTGGLKIQDVVMPWPYGEPSPTLKEILTLIEADARRLSGILELPMGEGRVGDVPATTIMSYIDSISKVPSAVHKDDHMAQQEEFELLRELLIEEPEALWKFARRPNRQWTAAELEDQELTPAADPNVPSQIHRISQVTAAVTMAGLPQFGGIPNQRGVWDWATRTLGVQDNSSITKPESEEKQQPPDPKMLAAMGKLQVEQMKGQTKIAEITAEHQARQQELAVESADRAADRASRERVEAQQAAEAQIKAESAERTMQYKAQSEAAKAAADTQNAGLKAAETAANIENKQADTAATITKAHTDAQLGAGQLMADHAKTAAELDIRKRELDQADTHHKADTKVAMKAASTKAKAAAKPKPKAKASKAKRK